MLFIFYVNRKYDILKKKNRKVKKEVFVNIIENKILKKVISNMKDIRQKMVS